MNESSKMSAPAGWKVVNKSEYAQPQQGYCNVCAETRLITHCAYVVTRGRTMQKLNLCSTCEKTVDTWVK